MEKILNFSEFTEKAKTDAQQKLESEQFEAQKQQEIEKFEAELNIELGEISEELFSEFLQEFELNEDTQVVKNPTLSGSIITVTLGDKKYQFEKEGVNVTEVFDKFKKMLDHIGPQNLGWKAIKWLEGKLGKGKKIE